MPGLRLLEEFTHISDFLASRLRRKPARAEHLELGRQGEEAAYFYLRRNGYVVVARGWQSGKVRGDLDLVGWDADTLCFVEVKSRIDRRGATAEAAVDEDKVRVLRRLARQYMQAMDGVPAQVRFDVLSIYLRPQREFELIRGAFGWR